jgi:uncharacterized damage-inducible protein DinB
VSSTRMIRELFQHMEWADALVWRVALSSPVVAGDSVIRDRLLHMHIVQHGFLRLWRQEPLPKLPQHSDFPELKDLASWCREYHARAAAFLTEIDDASLEKLIGIPWADQVAAQLGRAAAPVTLGQTMMQVTSHTSHHRGQVNARVRELGSEPPLIDFIMWIWAGGPSADWNGISIRAGV